MSIKDKIANAKPTTWLKDGISDEEVKGLIENAKSQCGLISRKKLIEELDKYMTEVYDCPLDEVSKFQSENEDMVSYILEGLVEASGIINSQPQVQLINTDSIIKQIEEQTSFLKDCTKYGNKDSEQQHKSYSTMMMYEVADLVDDLIEIVRRNGEKEV